MSSGQRVFILLTAVVALAGCDSSCDDRPSAAPTPPRVAAAPPTVVIPPAAPAPSGGVECPTDAPGNVRVSSHDGSLDIEWRGVLNATGYAVEVQRFEATNEFKSWLSTELPALARSIAFRPSPGRYRARVQARGCMPGGAGNWSPFAEGAIDGPRVEPQPQPNPCVGMKRGGGTPQPPNCKP